jgi:hypothetical protein
MRFSILAALVLLIASLAKAEDVYASTTHLVTACRNVVPSQEWLKRQMAGNFTAADFNQMNDVYAEARVCYVFLWGYSWGQKQLLDRVQKESALMSIADQNSYLRRARPFAPGWNESSSLFCKSNKDGPEILWRSQWYIEPQPGDVIAAGQI